MPSLADLRKRIKSIKSTQKITKAMKMVAAAKLRKAQENAEKIGQANPLDAALDALEEDHSFLLKGDVFTQDVIDMWLSFKREREVDAMRLRPHPYEFSLYYDV